MNLLQTLSAALLVVLGGLAVEFATRPALPESTVRTAAQPTPGSESLPGDPRGRAPAFDTSGGAPLSALAAALVARPDAPHTQAAATVVMSSRGPGAVASVAGVLSSMPDSPLRAALCEWLASRAEPQAAGALLDALLSADDPRVEHALTSALAASADASAIRAIALASRDAPEDLHNRLARAVMNARRPDAVPALIELGRRWSDPLPAPGVTDIEHVAAFDGPDETEEVAWVALAAIGTREAAEAIVSRAIDDPSLRHPASIADAGSIIGQLRTDEARAVLESRLLDPRAARTPTPSGASPRSPSREATEAGSWEAELAQTERWDHARAFAVEAIARFGDERALATLERLRDDDSHRVRRAVRAELARLDVQRRTAPRAP